MPFLRSKVGPLKRFRPHHNLVKAHHEEFYFKIRQVLSDAVSSVIQVTGIRWHGAKLSLLKQFRKQPSMLVAFYEKIVSIHLESKSGSEHLKFFGKSWRTNLDSTLGVSLLVQLLSRWGPVSWEQLEYMKFRWKNNPTASPSQVGSKTICMPCDMFISCMKHRVNNKALIRFTWPRRHFLQMDFRFLLRTHETWGTMKKGTNDLSDAHRHPLRSSLPKQCGKS